MPLHSPSPGILAVQHDVSRTKFSAKSFQIERLEARCLLAIDLQLLKDLSTKTQPLFEVGNHTNLVQVGDVGYFTAVHPLDGEQLWKIDPALDGAQFVADI